VASALGLAPAVAGALAAHLPHDPDAALSAARAVVWPPAARAVHRFRRIGLEALLRMPPEMVPEFFGVFFALPDASRWSYLTGRADLIGTAATMTRLFAAASWELRARLIAPALLPRARAQPDPAPLGRAGT
jgi:lycopene beta-cyclase